jgi:RNA polymerase sigma-70 factor (ECF subfamily)
MKVARSTPVATNDAFDHAFALFYPRVHRVLSGLLGPDDADDAAQEVFLRLHDSRLVTEPDAAVGPWLYRVAVNCAYNRLRSRRRQAAHLQRAGALAQSEAHGDATTVNPADALVQAEDAGRVRQALALLSETHRTVLVLRNAGLSYAEIAEVANVKASSIGTLLSRAERHLRDHYLHLAGDAPALAMRSGERP